MHSGRAVRRVLFVVIILVATISRNSLCAQSNLKPYDSVKPLIGTAGGGNTFPGATLPFGMVQ
jgi:putative alpha-1,2-mannosidase